MKKTQLDHYLIIFLTFETNHFTKSATPQNGVSRVPNILFIIHRKAVKGSVP